MYGYIYKTTNLVNGKIYIGQHKTNLNQLDTNYLGSGKLILEAIQKYGKENFKCEILEWCETEKDLEEKELFYIKEYRSTVDYNNYNISDGGFVPRFSGERNGMYGKHIPKTEEQKKHLSEVAKGHKPTFKGKHTEETKRKIGLKSSINNSLCINYSLISTHHTGSKMLTNGVEQHWFYGEDVEKMKQLGWYEGVCRKRKPKTKTQKTIEANIKNGIRVKNSIWVHKEKEKHLIYKQDLDKYISLGYTLGMKDKNKQ